MARDIKMGDACRSSVYHSEIYMIVSEPVPWVHDNRVIEFYALCPSGVIYNLSEYQSSLVVVGEK